MKHKLLVTSLLCLALGSASLQASTLYWSGGGTALGGGGTWNTTGANWGTSSSGPFTTVWNNAQSDSATLSAGAGATGGGSVVLGVPITMNGTLTWQQTPGSFAAYTINGPTTATMTFSSGSAISCNNSAGGSISVGSFNGTYAGTITKSGAASLTFNNASGNVTKFIFQQGTASFASPSRFGTGADSTSFLTFNGGIMSPNTTLAWTMGKSITVSSGNGTINASSTTITITQDKPITWSGGNLTIQTSPLILSSTTSSGSGTLTLSTATSCNAAGVIPSGVLVSMSASTLTLNNNSQTIKSFSGAGAIALGSGTLTINSANSETASGVISGTGGVTLNAGTWTISGANTYSGITTVLNGSLVIKQDNNLGTAPASPVANQLTLNNNINNGANNYGLRDTGGNFTLSFNRGITLGANGGSINVQSGYTLCVAGVITGNGDFWASPTSSAGYGSVVVSNANNNFTGSTYIGAGTLQLGVNGALPAGTPLTIGSSASGTGGGSFFNMNSKSQTIGPLASSTGFGATGTGTPTVQLTGALTINETSSTVFAGVISGSGGSLTLSSSSTGTLTLSGVNTYSGNTTISAGTLALNGSGSISSSANIIDNATFDVSGVTTPPYSLASGQTLSGTGTVHGQLTVASGATVAPGVSSIGTLTFDNSLTLSGITSMEINKTLGTADKIVMSSGTVTLGGALSIANLAGTLAPGDTFSLVGGTIAGGTFTSVSSPGAGLAWDTSQLQAGGNGTVKVICDGTLAAHAGANQDICSGSGVAIGGSPTASGGSGTGTYTYSWSPSTGLSSATVSNPTASPASTTTYTVTVTDANGCTASSSMTVNVNAAPAISAQPANTAVCDGSTATFSVTAAGSGLTYSWANDSNGGWGNAWAVSGSGSTWLGTSTDNDNFQPDCTSFGTADIDSPVSGNALGIYGGTGGDEVATRTFTALAVGQVVSIDFDNGNVDNGSKAGFSLQTAGGAADVLQFYFLGGAANYKYWDDLSNEEDTGVGWGYTGTRVQFVLTSASTYSLIITPCGGTATTLTGTYSGAAIAQVKLFNGNTAGGDADNVYFNNFLVGGYTDNADNYSGGDYAGQDKGNQPIASGNGDSTYTTPVLSVADSGTQYQVVVNGCGGTVLSTTATVTVNPLPTVSVNSATVCAGGSATLTATTSAGTPTYLWSPGGATTASITVSPASTTTYTVTVTDGTTSCANSGSGTVTVNPLPTVSVNSQAICAGDSATLTATTSASSPSYLWNDPDNSTTASITVSPATTTTYTVTVTDGVTGCANSGSGTVTVNPLPTASVNSATVCAGGSATLTATTSASNPSYLWNDPDNSTTATITVSPAATTTYTVTVTDGDTGCANSGSGTVTVNPLPTVSVNSATVCAGASATLTATTSASSPSYLWSPGGATAASITVSPAATTTYTVTVTDDGTLCANSGSGTVTVNPLPTVSVNSTTICAGGSATLTATTSAGTPSYLWSPDGQTTASITVSPASTTTYTVTVTDGGTLCANSGSGTVTVNPQPVLTIDTTNQTACAGSEVMWSVAATGTGLGYQWQRDGTNLLEGVDGFTGVTTATLTNSAVAAQDGVDAAHGYACIISSSPCSDITSTLVSLTVNPLPAASVNSAAVCAGGSATLTATTDASSPAYLWNDPANSTTASIIVSPATTTTYTVTVTDGVTGCANSGSGTVTVNPLPTASVNSATVCAGGSATLTATTDASSPAYLWNDPANSTTASITVSPATTTTYTVTVTDGVTGCANSGSGTVTVNPLPTASVNSATVCAGGSATLTATTDASSPAYLWNDPGNSTTASITVSPATTTTYTVTVTDGVTGCANSGSGTVTVNPLPTASVNSAAICGGGSATLTATTSAGTPSYLWSPGGETTASITVSPASTTTYTVTVTDGGTGCANSGSGTVTVNSAPTAAAASDQTVCAGSPVEIGGSPTASGGTAPYTYLWAPATGLSDATVDNPTASVGSTTTYTVTVTDANGCTANASVVLTVPPLPNIESTTLVGSDVTLVWDSLAGQVYRVQYTTDLPNPPAAATWTDLTPDVTATGATATYTDTGVPPTQRFYRIFIVCP